MRLYIKSNENKDKSEKHLKIRKKACWSRTLEQHLSGTFNKLYQVKIYIYILCVCLYIYIKNAIFKCLLWNIWIKKAHKIYSNDKYFSSFQKLCQCIIKLQTKIQITQQHKSKLKNTYRIKEIIVKGKI